jgi:hypothetical protein
MKNQQLLDTINTRLKSHQEEIAVWREKLTAKSASQVREEIDQLVRELYDTQRWLSVLEVSDLLEAGDYQRAAELLDISSDPYIR